jgi:glutamate-1-semialdehyde 2,1-aminomutase
VALKNTGDADYSKGQALARRARAIIPGGCHTYAKGEDQFPELSPAFIVRGHGCHVWDVDGNEFIEYAMGLRAVTLGHAYPAVCEAVARELPNGTNFNRPAPIEVRAAESLLECIAGAEMVKFCKDGSAALDGAVKLARAHTSRDMLAICGDHPFFSSSDWFIGSTAIPGGVPEWTRSHTVKFRYNELQSLDQLFARHADRIACVVLEAAKHEEPQGSFLHDLIDLTHRRGAVVILDEMITGFRWDRGGAQRVYGIDPDLSTFGKALANGFALSALVGKREIMRLGGLDHDRERVFLMSTTHGAETHALAAGIATMNVYRDEDVIGHLYRAGARLRSGIEAAAREFGVERYVGTLGRDCCLVYFTRDREGRPSQELRTLFQQELIRRGVLAPSFIVSYSHQDADIDATIEAVRGALPIYRDALEHGVERYLVGRPVKPVYRPYA